MEDSHDALDARVLFAAERTLLAWVRTGLAMMGFGFVVARFGLLLRELAFTRGGGEHPQPGMSFAFGITLVLLGVVVNICAAWKHWRTIRRLERGQPLRASPFSLEIVMATILALLGLLMAAYLFLWPRGSHAAPPAQSNATTQFYRGVGLDRLSNDVSQVPCGYGSNRNNGHHDSDRSC